MFIDNQVTPLVNSRIKLCKISSIRTGKNRLCNNVRTNIFPKTEIYTLKWVLLNFTKTSILCHIQQDLRTKSSYRNLWLPIFCSVKISFRNSTLQILALIWTQLNTSKKVKIENCNDLVSLRLKPTCCYNVYVRTDGESGPG